MFNNFSKSRLRSAEHYSAMVDLLNMSYQYVNSTETLKATYKSLSDATEEEDRCIKINYKSAYSDAILEYDGARDRIYSLLKRMAEVASTVLPDPYKSAGKHIVDVINLHRVSTKDNYDQQTGAIANVLQDVKDADLEALGIPYLVENLTQYINKLRQAVVSRAAEMSKVEKGALKAARSKTDAAFKAFLTRLNAVKELDTEGKLDALEEQWNTYLDHFRMRYARHVARVAKDDPATPEDADNTATPATDPVDDGSEEQQASQD